MIEKKLEFVEDVLKDVLNYIAEDAECICDETTLEYAKEQMDKLDKAIAAVKELRASHPVGGDKCVAVSPEELMMRYCGEKYVYCKVEFKDDPYGAFDTYIKLDTEDDSLDSRIIYYCDGIDELIKLTDKDNVEDFYVKEIIEFTNEIN